MQYWRGIREALTAQGVKVITATVPPSASIEERAEELAREIEAGARGKDVNIIAYVDAATIGRWCADADIGLNGVQS